MDGSVGYARLIFDCFVTCVVTQRALINFPETLQGWTYVFRSNESAKTFRLTMITIQFVGVELFNTYFSIPIKPFQTPFLKRTFKIGVLVA